MRAILAALFVCAVASALSGQAHAHVRHRHHPDAAGMIAPGLIHMMRSAKHRHAAYRAMPLDAVFTPFEPGPFSMLAGAGQTVVDGAFNAGARLVRGIARGARGVARSVGEIVAHPPGCPRVAFCGCGAADKVFGAPRRDLWRAAAWFKFRRAAPGPGMVAVRAHHVFVILQSYGDGTVLAWDANSGGHQTRIHRVSLAGYSVRDPHG